MPEELAIGQILYCKNGETVEVRSIASNKIFVCYNGKEYARSIEVIGKTLFELKCGMTLYLQDGESVKLTSFTSEEIIFLYKEKECRKSIKDIGYTLFFNQHHYDSEGYDEDGYNKEGFNKSGYNRKGFNKEGFDKEGFDASGYDKNGFNKEGYNIDGFDKMGYDKSGYDKEGFDKDGFNSQGFDEFGYNQNGFDKDGYNRDGYNKFGYDRKGYDRFGYNRNGFDKDGYSRDGFNKLGYDKSGYDIYGFDSSGFNKSGFDRKGFNRQGFNREGYDIDGYDIDGYDKFDINRNSEFRPGSKIESLLRPNKTILYHNVFGSGTLKKVEKRESSIILEVQFKSKVATFVYPNCFSEGFLHFDKTGQISEFENFINTPNGKKIYDEESQHLSDLMNYINSDVEDIERKYSDTRYDIYNVDNELWSAELGRENTKKYSNVANELKNIYSIRKEPYFARVDSKNSSMYIGKAKYRDIVEWTDPRCSLYYEYQMYIGNEEYELSLVRDIKINSGALYFIKDKYNAGNAVEKSAESSSDNTITDPRLLMIINANRNDKNIHDIIATIQKNQYKIITEKIETWLMVNGCAGSGKTMILLHRLQYLMRNNPTLSPKSIFALSPTSELCAESSQLASNLGMQAVNMFSNARFFNYILKKEAEKNEWEFPEEKNNYKSLTGMNNILMLSLYDEKNLQNIYCDALNILSDPDEKEKYISFVSEDIRQNKINFLSFAYEKSEEEDLFSSLDKAYLIYLEVKEDAAKLSMKNLDDIIEDTAKKYPERVENVKKAVNLLKKHPYMLSEKGADNATYDKLTSLYKKDGFLEKIKWDTDKYYFGNEDPIYLFGSIYESIAKSEIRLSKFKNGNHYACIFDIINYAIRKHKNFMRMDPNSYSEWDLFAKVYVISKFTKKDFDDVKLFFIDEIQDYSIIELNTIKKLFPNAVFNYFGDFNQSIVSKGIKEADWKKYTSENAVKCYGIQENYRNAKEITEYVNDQFYMDMRPVGIHGTVQKIRYNDILNIPIASDDRVVIISSYFNIDKIYKFITEILKAECHKVQSTNDFQRGILNISTVIDTKGLEFEKIILISEDMSENEKYVAMTRALNSLYIVE